jgi:hypothetical protein
MRSVCCYSSSSSAMRFFQHRAQHGSSPAQKILNRPEYPVSAAVFRAAIKETPGRNSSCSSSSSKWYQYCISNNTVTNDSQPMQIVIV